MSSSDEAVAALARRQHSVFSGSQAARLGLSRKVLRRRAARGQLTRLDHDVYHVAGTPLTWRGRLAALLLAGGDGAVVSHRSAAALWGLEGFPEGILEVTVPRGTRLRRPRARVHESTDLDRCGMRRRDGLAVTDPARTLLDIARRSSDVRVLWAVESARRRKLTDWSELIATLAKHARRGRPGVRRLRRVIARSAHRTEVTDSDFELLVLVLLTESGLPEPVVHHVLRGPDGRFLAEIDLAYPELRIAIELDGAKHREKEVFERDRPRQNRVVLEGWTVLRFTWDEYAAHPEQVVAQVRAAIRLAQAASR